MRGSDISPGCVSTVAGQGSDGITYGKGKGGVSYHGWCFLISCFRALNSPRMGAWASTSHISYSCTYSCNMMVLLVVGRFQKCAQQMQVIWGFQSWEYLCPLKSVGKLPPLPVGAGMPLSYLAE